jgi:hypothetical protein
MSSILNYVLSLSILQSLMTDDASPKSRMDSFASSRQRYILFILTYFISD